LAALLSSIFDSSDKPEMSRIYNSQEWSCSKRSNLFFRTF